ncbi:Pentatricopeptide repeat-containing protein [Drosera capensis]
MRTILLPFTPFHLKPTTTKTTSFIDFTSSGSLKTRWVCTVAMMVSPNGSMRASGTASGKNPTSKSKESCRANALLRRFVTLGELEKGFSFLEKMVLGEVDFPDVDSCARMIHGFCEIGETMKAIKVLVLLEESGVIGDVIIYDVLIKRCYKEGNVDKAFELLNRLQVHNVSYGGLMRALFESDVLGTKMKMIFLRMEEEGYPDVIKYSILLETICKECGVGKGKEFLDEMQTRGCQVDIFMCNVLIKEICKKEKLDDAIKFMKGMSKIYGCGPNVISYNIIIRGLCTVGRCMDAEELLADMSRRGCSPDVVTFNMLIKSLCRIRLVRPAIDVLEKMPSYGCMPNTLSYNPLLNAFCKQKDVVRTTEYLDKMESQGCYPNIYSYNSLLSALCKDGKFENAVMMLNQLKRMGYSPVPATYNIMIRDLSKAGKTDQGLKLLAEMKEEGLKPTLWTYTSLISGFVREKKADEAGKTEQGLDLLVEMKKTGLRPDIAIYNILISGLARDGKVDQAMDLFKDIQEQGVTPDVVTYNSILTGLCKTRKAERALELLAEMKEKGLKLNIVTYESLINGLSREGKEDQAMGLLAEMKGLKPDIVTYTSLISGLGGEGIVDETMDLLFNLEELNVTPDSIAYNYVMLQLCKARRTDLAIDCLTYMVCNGFKPNARTYEILIDGIAAEGLAEEAQELLDELGARGLLLRPQPLHVTVKMQQDYTCKGIRETASRMG